MNDRIAVDTNAVVDFLRATRPAPPPLLNAEEVFLPRVARHARRNPDPERSNEKGRARCAGREARGGTDKLKRR